MAHLEIALIYGSILTDEELERNPEAAAAVHAMQAERDGRLIVNHVDPGFRNLRWTYAFGVEIARFSPHRDLSVPVADLLVPEKVVDAEIKAADVVAHLPEALRSVLKAPGVLMVAATR